MKEFPLSCTTRVQQALRGMMQMIFLLIIVDNSFLFVDVYDCTEISLRGNEFVFVGLAV